MNERIYIPVLEKLKTNLRNPSRTMKYIASDLMQSVKRNFEYEGRGKWKPLSSRTIKQRTRLGYWPGKILQRTGELKRSITSGSDQNSAWVGTNKRYAALHQFGGHIFKASRNEKFIRSRYKRGSKKGKFKKMKSYELGKGMSFRAHTINVPARPFLTVSYSDLVKIKNHFLQNLLK